MALLTYSYIISKVWYHLLNWDRADRVTSGGNKKKFIRPIWFLYYEESLVSSILNSKLLGFHCGHPNLHIPTVKIEFFKSSCSISYFSSDSRYYIVWYWLERNLTKLSSIVCYNCLLYRFVELDFTLHTSTWDYLNPIKKILSLWLKTKKINFYF